MEKFILFIKDSKSRRKVLLRHLARHYNIVEKNNAADAIYWLMCGNHAQAILTDVEKEEMIGLEFLNNLNKINYKTPPIIMLSDCNDQNKRLKYFQLGVWNCVAKPFSTERVLEGIKDAIGKKIAK